MPGRRSRRKGKSRKAGRRFRRRRGRKLRRKERIPRAIKEMIAITEPITNAYSWTNRYVGTQNNSQLILFLQWNDGPDIANFHNNLKTQLNMGGFSPCLNKFAVGRYDAEFTVKNTANMEFTMDMYTAMFRDDTNSSITPLTNWNAGSGTVQYADPLYCLRQGLQEAGNVSIPAQSSWPVGINPFDINKFCHYMKILKVKKDMKIVGAGFKTFKIRDRKWRIWNGTEVFNASGAVNPNYVGFSRRTKFVFGILTGQGVSDQSTTTSVAFAPTNVIVTGQERYQYTGVNNSTKKIFWIQDANTVNTYSTIDLQTEVAAGYVVA